VLACWRDKESAVGRRTVLACWHDDELAAGQTMVLTCGHDNGVGGRADNGASALVANGGPIDLGFGAMKTFGERKPTNGQGGASARLKEGLKAAWQQMRGAIDMFA
jgi:hypothetical protein